VQPTHGHASTVLPQRLLACVAASSAVIATAAAAHADATPGVAEAVAQGGICNVGAGGFYCSAKFDFVMALPASTILVDWGDGTTETFSPGSSVFQESHTWAAEAGFDTWTVSMSVDGGPVTSTVVTCLVNEPGVCD
jgi:hypothetical protein